MTTKKKAQSAPRKKTVRIYGRDGKPELFWTVPYSNGTKTIEVRRTLDDVKHGKPGSSVECADSRCIFMNKSNAHKFPHPVLMVHTIKSITYIVDKVTKKDGPIHAVRYGHNDRDSIRTFDQPMGKEFLLKSGKADKVLRFFPPKSTAHGSGPSTPYEIKPRSAPRISRGALGRARDAGLIA